MIYDEMEDRPNPEDKRAEAWEYWHERANKFETALYAITKLEPTSFVFPADWQQQIDNCPDCRRYKGHPIQQGICNVHRQPIWSRERHDNHEQRALIYRAKEIARAALTPSKQDKLS